MNALNGRIAEYMNMQLNEKFIKVEVYVVLQYMHPYKASGSDGMPPVFFSKYWKMITCLVTSTILQALNESMFPNSINRTIIT